MCSICPVHCYLLPHHRCVTYLCQNKLVVLFCNANLFVGCATVTKPNEKSMATEQESKRGVHPDGQPGDSLTVVLSCLENKNISLLKDMCNNGFDVNALTNDGRSLVQFAVAIQCYEGVNILAHFGISVNVPVGVQTPQNCWSPLHIACDKDDIMMCKILLAHGAYIDTTPKMSSFEKGETPLEYAVKLGKMKCAKLLIQHGANAYLDATYGSCVIAMCVQRRDLRLIHELHKRGEKFGVHHHDLCDCSPLQWVALPSEYVNDETSERIGMHMAQLFVSSNSKQLRNFHWDFFGFPRAVPRIARYLHHIGCVCNKDQLSQTQNKQSCLYVAEMQNERSLQALCRSFVRKNLLSQHPQYTLMTTIHCLPVPLLLREYLLYGEQTFAKYLENK